MWYWVSMNYATGGIEVDSEGIIITTPPIWKKWKGQSVHKFFNYYDGNKLTVKKMVNKDG